MYPDKHFLFDLHGTSFHSCFKFFFSLSLPAFVNNVVSINIELKSHSSLNDWWSCCTSLSIILLLLLLLALRNNLISNWLIESNFIIKNREKEHKMLKIWKRTKNKKNELECFIYYFYSLVDSLRQKGMHSGEWVSEWWQQKCKDLI